MTFCLKALDEFVVKGPFGLHSLGIKQNFYFLHRVRKRKEARPSLGAHPVIVSGPLGVVTSAELFWIIGMLLFAAWMLIIYLVKTFPSLAEQYPEASTAEL